MFKVGWGVWSDVQSVIFLDTIVEKTYPEPWNYSFESIKKPSLKFPLELFRKFIWFGTATLPLCHFKQFDVTLYHCYFDFKDCLSFVTLVNQMSLYFVSALIWFQRLLIQCDFWQSSVILDNPMWLWAIQCDFSFLHIIVTLIAVKEMGTHGKDNYRSRASLMQQPICDK